MRQSRSEQSTPARATRSGPSDSSRSQVHARERSSVDRSSDMLLHSLLRRGGARRRQVTNRVTFLAAPDAWGALLFSPPRPGSAPAASTLARARPRGPARELTSLAQNLRLDRERPSLAPRLVAQDLQPDHPASAIPHEHDLVRRLLADALLRGIVEPDGERPPRGVVDQLDRVHTVVPPSASPPAFVPMPEPR